MGITTILGVAAGTWGVAMALAPLLQIRAIRAEGNSDSVSTGQWIVWSFGFSLWLAYGISTTDWPIIVTNLVALTMGLTTLAVVIRYRTQPQSAIDDQF